MQCHLGQQAAFRCAKSRGERTAFRRAAQLPEPLQVVSSVGVGVKAPTWTRSPETPLPRETRRQPWQQRAGPAAGARPSPSAEGCAGAVPIRRIRSWPGRCQSSLPMTSTARRAPRPPRSAWMERVTRSTWRRRLPCPPDPISGHRPAADASRPPGAGQREIPRAELPHMRGLSCAVQSQRQVQNEP